VTFLNTPSFSSIERCVFGWHESKGGHTFPNLDFVVNSENENDFTSVVIKLTRGNGFKTSFVYKHYDDPSPKNKTKRILFTRKEECGKNIEIAFTSYNFFGGNISKFKEIYVPCAKYKPRQVMCWNSTAPVKMADRSFREIQSLSVGDFVMSLNNNPTEVKFIKTTEIFGSYKMVKMSDHSVTIGHPLFYNGDWFRPDEIFPVNSCVVGILYNLYCEPYHEVIIGQKEEIIYTSLGGNCPRIAKIDPYTDIIYGTGYKTERAKRYKWLLSNETRIPNDQVEEATDNYWKIRELTKEIKHKNYIKYQQ